MQAVSAASMEIPKQFLWGLGLEGFQKRAAVELQSSGVTELDAVLGGGFPRGSLVELCGPACFGLTSLAFSLLAQATERQEVCAFVDWFQFSRPDVDGVSGSGPDASLVGASRRR